MSEITNGQKRKIYTLLANGYGYRKIATLLGISIYSSKMVCKTCQEELIVSSCKNCGKETLSYPCYHRKKFCSDECRRDWWSKNKNTINRKMRVYVCENCGKEFLSYRKSARYCSRQCSGKARRRDVTI